MKAEKKQICQEAVVNYFHVKFLSSGIMKFDAFSLLTVELFYFQ